LARLIAPVVTNSSIILNSNKIQNGDILVSAYAGCPVKWPLSECCNVSIYLLSFSQCARVCAWVRV